MSNLMLIGGIGEWFADGLTQAWLTICFLIDYALYGFITFLYGVFKTIAEARFFTSETVQPFIERMYLVVGILALFFAAYTLMTLIINPDDSSKGKNSPAGVVKNIMLSILAIVFIPSLFNFAYAMQAAIIDKNVISKIITRNTANTYYQDDQYNLSEFSVTLFTSTFYERYSSPNESPDENKWQEAHECLYGDGTSDNTGAIHRAQKNYNILSFKDCLKYADAVGDDSSMIQYNYIVSGIVGVVVVYVFISYCIDLGVRAIKLGFLQIIFPLPALLLMIPGQDKVFKSWLKDTLKTFLDVFMKVFIIVFGVYMIQIVDEWFKDDTSMFAGASDSVANFSKIFIFVGICIFIKRAPKLFKDLFGLDFGEAGLSIRKRVDEFKDAVSPITNVANRTAGMVGGIIAANAAYNEGLKAGNKGSAIKRGLANFHGMRNGWNGGLSNVGKAYDYELDAQQSYALNRDKGEFGQVVGGITDSLRDNLGFGSRYDYIKRRAELERDSENAPRLETVNNLRRATSEGTQQIKNEHKTYIDDNQAAAEAGKKWDDAREKELSKVNSQEKFVSDSTHRDRRLDNDYRNSESNSFKMSYTSLDGSKTDTYNLHELKEMHDRTTDLAEKENIARAMINYQKEYGEYVAATSNNNWAALEALADRINKDTTLDATERARRINFVESAKEAIKLQYSEKDEADQASDVVLALNEYKNLLKLGNTKVGIRTELDKNGKINDVVDVSDSEIKAILEHNDVAKLSKLKKKFAKIVDEENRAINTALSEAKVTEKGKVYYIDDDGTRKDAFDKTYLELERIIKDRTAKIEEKNKATEKILESYDQVKQESESRKHRAQTREQIKKSGPKPGGH